MYAKRLLSAVLSLSLMFSLCACSTGQKAGKEVETEGVTEAVVSEEGTTGSEIQTESDMSSGAEMARETTTVDASGEFSMWNSQGTIQHLIDYVEAVTDEQSDDFIPVADRIAVFDLDGTLVGEQFPIYFEWLMFAQRVLDDPDFQADDEMKEVAREILTAGQNRSIPEDIEEKESQLFGKAFDGMTTEEYRNYVRDFLSQEADGFDGLTFGGAYYRPMTEVISYLEEHDFKVYICSGTDRDADRVMVSGFSDIPMYQVIGSDCYSEGSRHDEVYYLDYQFDPDEEVMRDDTRIIKNVKSSKVVQMAQELGQKPVLAFGNSSGDTSMFIYTTYNNPYKSAAFCLVPDDDEREYAYPEKVEKLKKSCEENGWYPVSMKDDFLTIYGDDVVKNAENLSFTEHLLETCPE